mmetsp:Transcript_5802/g.15134  ORF Transcript_5802/g.15134 Transcript_5802/m.15134 type:complete len:320 (-) Transcript_5802:137-1096(-)
MKRRHDERPRARAPPAGPRNARIEADPAAAPAVRGQSRQLEKAYCRLGGLPDPSAVRPPRVLAEALEVVKRRWVQDADYEYAREQLKSIRQDLTVQLIQDVLAAEVYETHARIAIEADDLDEFNQCQAQLQPIHALGHNVHNAAEFCAYRILYNSVVPPRGATSALVLALLQNLNPRALGHPVIRQALDAHRAIEASDFGAFFRMWPKMANLGRHFLDRVGPSMRRHALRATCVAFEPTIPLPRLAQLLGFISEDPAAACLANLQRFHGATREHFSRVSEDVGPEISESAAKLELCTRAFRQRPQLPPPGGKSKGSKGR